VRFPAQVLERVFRSSELTLSDDFIERVARPLAEAAGLASDDPAATFRAVNEDLRARNEATIRERLAGSDLERQWGGAFQQLPGSQVMSRFAEHRTYLYRGKPISTARHFGFDLASTARAPVTAAGAGRVVMAEDLGIYGNCVVVDHGIGLASLYGHLSQIDVAVGDDVEQGARLGLSGETGLAGGDHLHFAFLVGDIYVDPLEWWDPKWVRSHVEVRLERSGP
jgi:murein DD-endopeptidase MepM/ murein hydrolase activator NlpD